MAEKSSSKRSKAQTFMPDFMASMVIFSLVVVIFLSSWSSLISQQGELSVESKVMEADHTSTFLVTTPGYPEDWDSENVEIVGFAQRENILDFDRIKEFGQISYQNQKRLMRAEDFYIEFRNETGTMNLSGEELFYGQNFTEPDFVYPVKRTVKINDSGGMYDARMNYVVYSE